ncbi:MAG TPA: lytic murein transglycosylase [Solirubrobacteraceae bacterium]|nr:lytic murein transglycosylase [Solirubrobacteraceae bacterium]
MTLLLATTGLLALPGQASAAGEGSSTATVPATGVHAGEAGTTTTPTTSAPETEPTITVEPAPTPRPHRSAPQPPPQVARQRAQGGSRGAPAGTQPATTSRPSKKNGHRSAARAPANGPRAPVPSTVTPQLPLAFSASLGGIPAFFIESFRIPPFLLPLYQAAGTAYGVPWQVLAAINEVETDYGRDLSVSSAGAEGWMQFLPSSWALYGVDANGDGFKDPYNPADAIFAAARYLRAAGAASDLRGAIFAYNHSQGYVESVLLRARLLGGSPGELLGALTGLTQGRFPVHAPSHFADGFPAAPGGSPTLPGTVVYSQARAPVIAVQDGLIVRIGDSAQLGRFISLRDAYGNTYTYAQLGSIARLYPVLQPHEAAAALTAVPRAESPEPRPSAPASAGVQARSLPTAPEAPGIAGSQLGSSAGLGGAQFQGGPATATGVAATGAHSPAAPSAAAQRGATALSFQSGPNDVFLHALRAGVRVIAGTVLGRVGDAGGAAGPHMLFQIRPAGAGAPLIDPKPILDGWVALENTSIYRAGAAKTRVASEPTPGQVLLESKQQLQQQVLTGHSIALARCARQDVQGGRVDRRVLAAMEYLAASGLRTTVAGLPCSRVSAATAQSSSQAFDIVAVDGVAVAGRQGAGSLAEGVVGKLAALEGSLRPTEIASLIRYRGASNTVARADHYDRIEVSFASPRQGAARLAGAFSAGVTPTQWIQLIARLGQIPSPTVRSGPSSASIPDQPGSNAAGEGGSVGNH